ncbi:MAG TPA: glycosyltransferase family 4 protein [Thermoplasmata archaeon]|nr:glycosyltransferase family 4 protein [Thermoplasmata archaeon]
MRVAQVTPWFYPHLGGVESHVLSLSRHLAARGHDVVVVTSRHDPSIPEEENLFGIRVVRVRTRFVTLRTPVAPRTRGALERIDPEIIHAHSPPPLSAYYASKVAETRGVPFAVTHHCDPELPLPFGPLVEGLYRRTLGAATLRRADRVIVTTRTYAATSRAVWRHNPVVIPNAVDDRRFRPDADGAGVRARLGIPDGRPVVLLVGRIVPHKGIEHLVEAAQAAPDALFLVAGTGSSLPAMKRLSRVLRVDDRVRFIGRVSEARLPELYAACDVFVLPSVSRLEAFGIVALEAMATGKPVVVADIPGVRDVIEDGREGLLADPVNPQDLAAKINRLLEDPSLRVEMGRRGREKVEASFTIDRVTDQVVAVYEALLAGSSPQGTIRSGMRSPA